MIWTGGNIFRAVISVVLGGYLVLNAMQGDWVWVAIIAVVIALNVWTLTNSLRAASPPTTGPPTARGDDEH